MSQLCDHCGGENLDIDVKCGSCGRPLTSTGVHRLIGSVMLDQYEITDVLGQGGMSVVYKARHRLTEQDVALKILPRELAAHAQVKSRFLEEARALAQLDHANIVHLYNFGEADGCLVLAMQYVRGRTFEELILAAEKLEWRAAVQVSIDVLKALEYAHNQGIVHRDMKPSNILVRDDTGTATVMDFGIAKMTTSTRLTATGQTMGTVRYMSPEQVRGKDIDVRTDVYSLGATLFEAVVGDTPFDGETHFEIMTAHLNAPVPLPSELGAELPPALERVILKSLMKRKEDRFQTAFLFRKALEAVLAGEEPMLDRPVTETAKARPIAIAGPDQPTSQIAQPDARPPTAPPVPGIASSLEPSLGDSAAVALRSSRGPIVWVGLGLLVVAAGAVAFVTMRRGSGEPRAAVEPPVAIDAGPSGPPAPFLVEGMRVAVDQPYEADRIRVLSVMKRDPEQVAEAVRSAREDFLAMLAERGGSPRAEIAHLNVVVVPSTMICDRRLYESDQAYAGCEGRHSHYRPHERTLYVADTEQLLSMHLPSEVALQICLDLNDPVCDETFSEFEADLPARAKKPPKKRKR